MVLAASPTVVEMFSMLPRVSLITPDPSSRVLAETLLSSSAWVALSERWLMLTTSSSMAAAMVWVLVCWEVANWAVCSAIWAMLSAESDNSSVEWETLAMIPLRVVCMPPSRPIRLSFEPCGTLMGREKSPSASR